MTCVETTTLGRSRTSIRLIGWIAIVKPDTLGDMEDYLGVRGC